MLDEIDVNKLATEIDCKLKELQTIDFFNEFNKLWGKPLNLQSIHAHIGRHNNIYIDCVRDQFLNKDQYIAKWLSGLGKKIQRIEDEQRSKYNGNIYQNTSDHNLVRAIRIPKLKEYIFFFLERNFYRKYKERIRSKPSDSLWSLWMGHNSLIWGILISPVFRLNQWTNDQSEIRKADYEYWTVGHILEKGLINPDSEKAYKFNSLEELCEFYINILQRLSNSKYEKKIMEMYVEYLKNSVEPNKEPFLIPELRLNKEAQHKYRIDFTILNPYSMEAIGFELSPASSHNSIAGTNKKTQKAINEELKVKWQKEINKRNEYFSQFGISIITFADEQLQNIDQCFSNIRKYLAIRKSTLNLHDELDSILKIELN
ncbi:TPA: topoisomerase II [Legionella pneumophila]|nr:topoisomerase II [Legionella pneumophila]